MSTLPTVVGTAGLVPTPPIIIRADLDTRIAAVRPGYTSTLPGSLIEDILSTDTLAVVEMESARVETVNSVTPYGANAFMLNQLGQIYGVQPDPATTTSVFVVFSGNPGYVIERGFLVSDGTYQYAVQDGGIIGQDGDSAQLFCLATTPGSWAVPTNTVNGLITSVPSPFVITVTNQQPGTPSIGSESEESYRARTLEAGLASAQGMGRFLKTLLKDVTGVQPRLVSVVQIDGGGWEVLCGGGDPYQVAYAIWQGLFDVSMLVGSTIRVTGITKAANGVVTTDLNHGLVNGDTATIAQSNPTNYNGVFAGITVIDEKSFHLGSSTIGFPDYTSSAVVTPNSRNIVVTINNPPNDYLIRFVNPPLQTVSMVVTWNTSSTNFVSAAAVAQLGAPALVDYVNSILVGLPINLFTLEQVFRDSVASIIDPQLLTRMVFAVSINGVGTDPSAGTGIIAGDPESYFFTDVASIDISQG